MQQKPWQRRVTCAPRISDNHQATSCFHFERSLFSVRHWKAPMCFQVLTCASLENALVWCCTVIPARALKQLCANLTMRGGMATFGASDMAATTAKGKRLHIFSTQPRLNSSRNGTVFFRFLLGTGNFSFCRQEWSENAHWGMFKGADVTQLSALAQLCLLLLGHLHLQDNFTIFCCFTETVESW